MFRLRERALLFEELYQQRSDIRQSFPGKSAFHIREGEKADAKTAALGLFLCASRASTLSKAQARPLKNTESPSLSHLLNPCETVSPDEWHIVRIEPNFCRHI